MIADRDTLKEYYGQHFLDSAIPNTSDVEQIEKDSLKPCLDRAAKKTNKEGYKEIRDGAILLSLIDPEEVREKAPHCERLFETLTSKIKEN